MHNPAATSWNGQTDFWNYVDQAVVDNMLDQGLMALTDTSSIADAWRAILPNYQVGQAIAIKVNFNNANNCTDTDNQIDALAEPVNAAIRGLTQRGVAESDIWIFEARRRIPTRFVNAIQATNVHFFDRYCPHSTFASFDSNDPNAYVAFSVPTGIPTPPPIKVSDVIIDAAYLINMPIMKTHGGMGITLAFKNHFGTIDHPEDLHNYAGLTAPYYRDDYSVLVDLYRNPHVANKTVLTIGDGLFAAQDNNTAPPRPWNSFGNDVPNSLFFSRDPVAIDCVMCDFLAAEVSLPSSSDDYLQVAAQAGLGTYERGDPWGSGYSQIDYLKI